MDDAQEVKQGNAVDFEIQWVEEKKQEQLMAPFAGNGWKSYPK